MIIPPRHLLLHHYHELRAIQDRHQVEAY